MAEGKLENLHILRLNNVFLRNEWVKEEIQRKIRKYLEINGYKNKTYGIQQTRMKRKVYSGKCLHKKGRSEIT